MPFTRLSSPFIVKEAGGKVKTDMDKVLTIIPKT